MFQSASYIPLNTENLQTVPHFDGLWLYVIIILSALFTMVTVCIVVWLAKLNHATPQVVTELLTASLTAINLCYYICVYANL